MGTVEFVNVYNTSSMSYYVDSVNNATSACPA